MIIVKIIAINPIKITYAAKIETSFLTLASLILNSFFKIFASIYLTKGLRKYAIKNAIINDDIDDKKPAIKSLISPRWNIIITANELRTITENTYILMVRYS